MSGGVGKISELSFCDFCLTVGQTFVYCGDGSSLRQLLVRRPSLHLYHVLGRHRIVVSPQPTLRERDAAADADVQEEQLELRPEERGPIRETET